MNTANPTIWNRVDELYTNYGQRAAELAKQGKSMIGYVCSFAPLEMITAAGCVPFRMRGDVEEPITKGDTLLETIVCPFVRSVFDLSIKGKYDYLSGIVIPHACDSMTRSYSAWSYSLGLPYTHFVNIPSVVEESSLEFFREELRTFKRSLEEFTGREITESRISQAIRLHNEGRRLVRAIYEFRKPDPPMISGMELHKVLVAGSGLPVEEANALFSDVIRDLEGREIAPVSKGPRILLDAACVDNSEVIQVIEESGANLVVDTMCIGTRDHWPQTDESTDPIAALASRYLNDINCPKTYRDNTAGTFEGDIAARFSDAGAFAKDFQVDGIILYVYRYCDPFGFEVPARKAYYASIGVPLLYLEDQYSTGTMGQLKTRIQAFLEMIG